MHNQAQTVKIQVFKYAEALNLEDWESIATFYTEDGLFMPDGARTFSYQDLFKRSDKSYLKKIRFNIIYSIEDITINDRYAFVQALAKTITLNLATNQKLIETSRDFFVFRKELDQWLIYRYFFNKVKKPSF